MLAMTVQTTTAPPAAGGCTADSHEQLKVTPGWRALKLAGYWPIGGLLFEMRQCICGSTLLRACKLLKLRYLSQAEVGRARDGVVVKPSRIRAQG